MAFDIEGIAFDLGNTLVPDPFDKTISRKSVEFRSAFAKHGISLASKAIADAWSEANSAVHGPHMCHFFQEAPILSHFLEKLGIDGALRPDISASLLIAYRSALKTVVVSDPAAAEAREALAALRRSGKRLIVFSNGRQRFVELLLQWTGLAGYFDMITASEKIGIEKPDPRTFSYMLNALGTPPERSAYVGDDMANDIVPSMKAGMKGILFKPSTAVSTPWRNYDAKVKTRPDAAISSLGALLQIIR